MFIKDKFSSWEAFPASGGYAREIPVFREDQIRNPEKSGAFLRGLRNRKQGQVCFVAIKTAFFEAN
jgi:hypothetical protein